MPRRNLSATLSAVIGTELKYAEPSGYGISTLKSAILPLVCS